MNELNWLRIRFFGGFDPEEVEAVDPTPTPKRLRTTALAVVRARRMLLKFITPQDANQLRRTDEDGLLFEVFPTFDEDYERAMETSHEKREREKQAAQEPPPASADQADGGSTE